MRQMITIAVLLVIWLPYKMSDLSKDSSFLQDLGMAFLCFGIGALITRSIQGEKSQP